MQVFNFPKFAEHFKPKKLSIPAENREIKNLSILSMLGTVRAD